MTWLLLVTVAFGAEYHVVRSGDTVASIAAALDGVDEASLRSANLLGADATVAPGEVLRLPERDGGASQTSCLCALQGTGTATFLTGEQVDLAVGMRLSEGTMVCTDERSFASVRLAMGQSRADFDDVNLLPGTCLTVDSAVARGDARASVVSVDAGSVSVGTNAGARGNVTVRTPSGVTTGDGGGFRVTIEEGAARTEALDNAVAVIGGGVEVAVGAGQGTRVRTGEKPQDPVDLLPPGTPLAPADGALLRRPTFRWTDVPDALGFRVELALDDEFRELVYMEEVDASRWEPEFLFLPFRVRGLYWRVASFDRFGFLGRSSDARALVFPPGVGP